MKLVINIPEDCYRYIKELQSIIVARDTCKTIQMDVINAIKNGTPVQAGEWAKVTEAHEDIGYDRGFRDGYAQAVEERTCELENDEEGEKS